jgi:hypothetical protein
MHALKRHNGAAVTFTSSGLALRLGERTVWSQPSPLRAQGLGADRRTAWVEGAYSDIAADGDGFLATGRLDLPDGSRVRFEDRWGADGDGFRLRRTATVERAGDGRGFLSAFELISSSPASLETVEPFMPALMYGDNRRLPPGAIGGAALRRAGVTDVLVREDAMPAPLVAARRPDGASVALIHADPRGGTVLADTTDMTGHTLVNRAFDFASLGFRETDGRLRLALWFPGTEGGAARVHFDWGKRRFRPGVWRGRYHPLVEGLSQSYECVIALDRHEAFPPFLRWAWRAAFDVLDPPLVEHDLAAVEAAIVGHLSAMVEERPDGAVGVPFLVDADTGRVDDGFYGLGFCGRNEAVALHLLRIGHRAGNARYLEQGRKILDFWTSRTGPGFTPVAYRPDQTRFGGQDWFIHQRANVPPPPEGEAASLRELAEGHLGCLRAWTVERARGVEHPGWLAWCRGFGDWLLSQQRPSGGFPRWWRLNGDVLDPSDTGTFNAIPFLCELAAAVGDRRLVESAVRAGDVLWSDPATRGIFRGGTIDNPDVIDKEAASLSLEAFLALHDATGDRRWLDAARVAADVTESWMYLWNVPMPADADPDALDWKPGASTVGFQAVAIGGGGGDEYLAFNPGEFARLAARTGDAHYRRVAEILLHNTKAMLALPGRAFDLRGPGWQQEHWSLTLNRGCGAHRAWLPWVTVCHLAGIAAMADEGGRRPFRTIEGQEACGGAK